ncbi:MAG TPA: S1C family serine protease [Caldimonas sp.]|nr:S1C family serine protease [Caldimonas sp.]HEX4234322.1 S1C family serine protease [Caldimonas sp.]
MDRVSPRSGSALGRFAACVRRGVAWALAATVLAGACARADDAPAPTAAEARALIARLEAHKAALARANGAVVGIEAIALEDARSIATLGRERQGSGVLIRDDGLVLTIGYLILEADHVDLVAASGRRVPARVVAYDVASGFGLVQALAPLGVEPAPLGVSARVAADEPLVVASGGDERDLSIARMVSRRPFSAYWEYRIEGAIFTAPARTDHSGAGLFNAEGELVGVGSLLVGNAAGTGAPLRGNMFVPVDLLKPILDELRSHGSARSSARAWLGLNCIEIGGAVHVVRTTPDGPSETAGLQRGDVILAIDGTRVVDLAGFYGTLWRDAPPERDVVLKIRRDTQTLETTVHAVDRMSTLSHPTGV